MDIRRFLLVLRARYLVAVLVLLLTVAAATVGSEFLPKKYTAEASVMVDIRSPDPISMLVPPAMVPGSMGTQLEIIRSDLVSRKVVKLVKLDEDPTVRDQWLSATQGRGRVEDWLAALLQRGLTVVPSRDSNIIVISFRGGDPAFVAAVANAYAQAYIETSIELKVEPAKQYAKWFADQAKVHRDQVEKAQAQLSDFQQKKGIVATEETMDFELARLNELSARLTAAQGEIRDAQSKQRSGRRAADALPEALQDAVVSGLRTSIAQFEAKLKEAAGNLGIQHPQYQRMESELAELKNRLAAETSHVASGYTTSSAVGRTKEAELNSAIEAQKRKLLGIKKERDEISVLARDVETAKRAYEGVTSRLNQTTLESQATRTNVSVLSPALEPLEPSFPKPLGKMLLLAIALGTLLAGACVYALEMLDRRIRTADDLAEMLQLPVLAVIERSDRLGRLPGRARAAALPAR